jgi:hypothetical protein
VSAYAQGYGATFFRCAKKKKMPDEDVRSSSGIVDVQQKLNCALPSSLSLSSGFFRFQSLNGMCADFSEAVSRRPIQTDPFEQARTSD